LDLVAEAIDNAQVLEAMEKKKRWPIFMLKWIRKQIMKRKVVIDSDKAFQGKLRFAQRTRAASTHLKLAMIQMTWSAMIFPFLTS